MQTEFEDLKKRTSLDGDLLRKYEEALRQAEAFLREN
jgi:chromosome segregation ATPase